LRTLTSASRPVGLSGRRRTGFPSRNASCCWPILRIKSGRYLTEKLTALGVSAADYLRLILYEDGTTQAGCKRHGILAFTAIGSRVIYLCGRDFVRAAQRAPEEMRAVIIHEMLHSLGLGENPPSSKEITYRVKQRCWR
jgi:hypothetical protein